MRKNNELERLIRDAETTRSPGQIVDAVLEAAESMRRDYRLTVEAAFKENGIDASTLGDAGELRPTNVDLTFEHTVAGPIRIRIDFGPADKEQPNG